MDYETACAEIDKIMFTFRDESIALAKRFNAEMEALAVRLETESIKQVQKGATHHLRCRFTEVLKAIDDAG